MSNLMIINTDVGPIRIVPSEDVPEGAAIITQDNPNGTVDFYFMTNDGGVTRFANLDYAEIYRDWMNGTLHQYLKGKVDHV